MTPPVFNMQVRRLSDGIPPTEESVTDTSDSSQVGGSGRAPAALSYKQLLEHHSRQRAEGFACIPTAQAPPPSEKDQPRKSDAFIAEIATGRDAVVKPVDDWQCASQRESTENFRALRNALLSSGEAAASQRAEADRFCTELRSSHREADKLRQLVSELQASLLAKDAQCQRRIEVVERDTACADKGFEMLTAARTRADADLAETRERQLAGERRGDELACELARANDEIEQLRGEDSKFSAERLRFRLDNEHLLEELAAQRAATVSGRAELTLVKAMHEDHELRWHDLEEQACARAARETEAYTFQRLQSNLARATVNAKHQEIKAERASSAAGRRGFSDNEASCDHISIGQYEPTMPSNSLRQRPSKKLSRSQVETGDASTTREFWEDWGRRGSSSPSSRHSHALSRRRAQSNSSLRPEREPQSHKQAEVVRMSGGMAGENGMDNNRSSGASRVQFCSTSKEGNMRITAGLRERTALLAERRHFSIVGSDMGNSMASERESKSLLDTTRSALASRRSHSANASTAQVRLIGASSEAGFVTVLEPSNYAGSSPTLPSWSSNFSNSISPCEPTSTAPVLRDGQGHNSERSLLDCNEDRGQLLHEEMCQRLERSRRSLSSLLDEDSLARTAPPRVPTWQAGIVP